MKTNLIQTYDMGDNRGLFPVEDINPNSISGILNTNTEFSNFNYIMKLSGLTEKYNKSGIDNEYTLFVVDNNCLREDVLINMDKGTAISIIDSSTLKNRITGNLLTDTKSQYLPCVKDSYKLLITNPNPYQTVINNSIIIQETDIQAINGLIHVVSNIIFPYNLF
tara:strand:- start:31255 stop:31749 length:495 start_codon:yes stop_codon:yes gene_type:complete